MDMAKIELSHGSGGNKARNIIKDIFVSKFSNPILNIPDDSAKVEGDLAFTTDSFVVDPIFFPGGDIGKLSVCGTVNDLSMKGAKPLYLSVAFIIEEGFEIDDLEKIASSMAKEMKNAGVLIVTGDTKVIDRKNIVPQMYITTSGIGKIPKGIDISSKNAEIGDSIILSGTIADHGIAIMNARNDFGFKGDLKSDCACLNGIVGKFISKDVRVLRDPTRGGLAASLNEIAEASGVGIVIEEEKIPVLPQIKAACDLLGLDPMHVANEGKLVAFVKHSYADKALKAVKSHKLGKNAAIIGKAVKELSGVFIRTKVGSLRPLGMLEREQLPRIC
ncbi:MAG: hydrogenase expression/formation protein HypE [Candidatus Margulisiibacteriota bacterium]